MQREHRELRESVDPRRDDAESDSAIDVDVIARLPIVLLPEPSALKYLRQM
jgi:hypothetical protein